MKFVIALAVLAVVAARPGEFYDDKYDNFNVDEVIENKRLLKAYTLCFLDEGKCTPEGQDIKKWIPDGTTSSCSKCTEKQKPMVAKFIRAMIAQLPDEWGRLNKKVDPEQKYQDTLKEFLEKHAPK
ncbi:allergen Tha p 1 [Manduca sexta]|uniref:Uncharacterized protein n=1 Tax=Manduca sexta TaxID=7130 RepID=A0A922CSZ9_MANSE|nr:allergen Tha p 1 [Manduca sexta]XP_030030853.1 allergen Tha p 1 [Manduca sexta]KAG6456768.1 hypothetical protein O3G_MSEX009946 [Manduca sexta]KAG6456769.1 hypothetical protein O3G_MSEX009946 [Manduca sexta]KAG6456770.1 hypothetical protein O3G_MSEX009946 [Manduca sexta]